MACKVASPDLPIGLQKLIALDKVSINQKNTMFANKYIVTDAQGELLFKVKEDASALSAMLGGKDRGFHMDLYDENERQVISLRRPYCFGVSKLQVNVNGVLASVVRQVATFMKPVLTINDAQDNPVLRVKGPVGYEMAADFNVLTLDKKCIGCIQKKWGGMSRELFTNADQFSISFPLDLDVRYKAAIIGTCLLIDFLYYEKS